MKSRWINLQLSTEFCLLPMQLNNIYTKKPNIRWAFFQNLLFIKNYLESVLVASGF